MRFEETPDLFGVGVGSSTIGYVFCDVCGVRYNEHEKNNKENPDNGNVSVGNTTFAGMQVCDCCFERIEEEIWYRRADVLAWIIRRAEAMKKSIDKDLSLGEQGKKVFKEI